MEEFSSSWPGYFLFQKSQVSFSFKWQHEQQYNEQINPSHVFQTQFGPNFTISFYVCNLPYSGCFSPNFLKYHLSAFFKNWNIVWLFINCSENYDICKYHFRLFCLIRFFPPTGLNLQSQFNLENITVFNTSEQDSTLGQKVIFFIIILCYPHNMENLENVDIISRL